MRIERIEALPLRIPFDAGAEMGAFHPVDVVLVRVESDSGQFGYGEAFAYGCRRAVTATIEDLVAPAATGREVTTVEALMDDLKQSLHRFGRYGITLFALSGLDIALWDLIARERGVSLWRLLGEAHRSSMPGYASLVPYGEPEIVAERTRAAIDEGYTHVKLHETEPSLVAASRREAGPDVPLMVDVNCPWSYDEALARARALEPFDLLWLEEPVFPPEDFDALARLRKTCRIPLAAGENASTEFEFRKLLAAGAVDHLQPSVTKVGGVTEFLRIARLAEQHGLTLMPHSPYFGPGFLATLHLCAVLPGSPLVERLHVRLEASLCGSSIDPVDGSFQVSQSPGVGVPPDRDLIREYSA